MCRHILTLTVIALFLPSIGCEQAEPASPQSLRRPMDVALFCAQGSGCKPPLSLASDCSPTSKDNTLCALVSNGDLGDLALINIRTGDSVDTDPFVPGFTRHVVGGNPTDLLLSPDRSHTYIANPGLGNGEDDSLPAIDRINNADILQPALRQTLSGPALTPAYVEADEGDVLVAAAPDANGLWVIPVDGFGNHESATLESGILPLEGPPSDIAIHENENGVISVYVAYQDRARLSVVRLTDGMTSSLTLSGACNDGLDNDEDGQVDLSDEDCVNPDSPSESAIVCPDGDTLCPQPGDPIPTFSRVALSPDGRFAYITSRPHKQVFVVRTDTLTLLNVNSRPDEFGSPLLDAAGQRGIVMPGPPQTLAFAPTQTEVNGELAETITAFVATSTGFLYAIDTSRDGEDFHLLHGGTLSPSTINAPKLFDGGVQIEQSFTARTDYPNLGPFTVDSGANSFYGVTLTGHPRSELTENWNITHQGVIPGSDRNTGGFEILDDGETTGVAFKDPTTDFCSRGVEPGDILIFHPPDRTTCGSQDSPDSFFDGDRFEYTISEVSATSLTLDPTSGISVVITEEENEDGELETLETTNTAPAPDGTCLTTTNRVEIRVSPQQYTVVGSRSGFLHPWVRDGEICVLGTDDPMRSGRALESIPVGTPTNCTLPYDDALFATEIPFQNPVLSFQIRPGCQVDSTDLSAAFLDSGRNVSLRFDLSSGFSPTILASGSVLRKIRYEELDQRLYLIDEVRNNIQIMDLDTVSPADILQ